MYLVETERQAQAIMKIAMSAGEIMISNGAEIYRVEDTMDRMLNSCECIEDVQVVCTYSSLMASVEYDGEIITSMKKIKDISTDLQKIARVNDFSRDFVSKPVDLKIYANRIKKIREEEPPSNKTRIIFFALSSACFTVALGGDFHDFLATIFILSISQYISSKTANQGRKYFMDTLFSSIIIAALSVLLYEIGFAIDYNLVIIGSIFLLFPGISLTNSVRDFMNRDLLAGTIGILQALFTAAALAMGVGLVMYIYTRLII